MSHLILSRRRALQIGVTGVAAGAAWPLRAAGAARAAEEPEFEARDLDWVDARRQRPVPVRLYLPTGSTSPARALPLAVFSHGIGGTRHSFSWLGQHFAQHGIASLHLQHVGSDRQLWSGNPLTLVGRLQAAAQDSEAIARAQDLRFALDTLLQGELGPFLDTRRIVAAGHSYGANTTLLASGARVPRPGRTIDLHDGRIAAAIVLSAPPFYGEAEPRKVLSPIAVPSLHITATEDVIRIPGYFSGVQDRVDVFDAIGSPNKWLVVYAGGEHNMLSDRILAGGNPQNLQKKAATQTLVLAFLRRVFDGDTSAMALWPQQNAAVLARFAEGHTA
jgi:dienelactone hydrolase